MDTDRSGAKRFIMPRWLSVCLVAAVFFLPLHFHGASPVASQLTKECICLHGSKTHANLASPSALSAPAIVVCSPALVAQAEIDVESIRIPSSRAPPA